MPIFIVQRNNAIAGVASFPGAINLPCTFPSPNNSGNVLIAFVSAQLGTRPSSVTDSNGNNWFEVAQPVNVGDNLSMWAAMNINPGANTVTANGMSVTVTGGPNIVIGEFGFPPCVPCGVGIQGFNGPRSNSGFAPSAFTKFSTMYNVSQGPFFHTIIFGLYDNADGATATQRTWSYSQTLPGSLQDGGLIDQTAEDGGTNTSVCAYSTIGYPYKYNELQLAWTPTSPALRSDETSPFGMLITTTA